MLGEQLAHEWPQACALWLLVTTEADCMTGVVWPIDATTQSRKATSDGF